MTLFSLLIVMALERVTSKSKQFHIASIAQSYFEFLLNKEWVSKHPSTGAVVLLISIPALIALLLVTLLPMLVVFLINLLVLWVCLGCPTTRQTYKRYLQAANREDFQACALHSMEFGNEGGELSNVGKQLVLVNYRQYAAVVIFFVFFGVAGVIFYSLLKEWLLFEKRQQQQSSASDNNTSTKNTSIDDNAVVNDHSPEISPTNEQQAGLARLLFIADWLPVRLTAFGFLVVGHFSNALSAWVDIIINPDIGTYDALAKVSKAAEDVGDCDAHLNEPLQLVKLVKRNIVFMLMAISLMTMVGLVA